MWLKQSTAVTVKMGPFVDNTDGYTAETGLTISQADIRLTKNGGAFAQTNNAAGATHDENGYYGVPLNTTDTNTLGTLRVSINESGALPVWQDFMVVPANVYDSLFSTDKLQVDITQIDGQDTSGNNATLNLKQLNIVNSAGTALIASSTGANGHGINVSGNGSGNAMLLTAGATGDAIQISAIGGDGFQITAENGFNVTASNIGIYIESNADGLNIINSSGASIKLSSIGDGINIDALGDGIDITAGGSNHGIKIIPGATGNGINVIGGATSGSAVKITGTAGNAIGLEIVGQGSASGLKTTGGATGNGLEAAGGASSGYDILGDLQGSVTSVATDGITSGSLATSAVTEIVDAIKAIEIETGYDIVEILKVVAAATAGKASGFPTTNVIYRDILDSKNRITATVDTVGNRTAVTLDVT